MVRVLVFGVFDGVHEGHKAMLRQAKALGDYLVVAVAPDNVVEEIKGKICVNRSAMRIQDVRNARIADDVVLGDKLLNNWSVLKKFKPDIIALGYDQEEVKAALEEFLYQSSAESRYKEDGEGEHLAKAAKKPKIVVLSAYKPETFKSSFLNERGRKVVE